MKCTIRASISMVQLTFLKAFAKENEMSGLNLSTVNTIMVHRPVYWHFLSAVITNPENGFI